MPKNILLLVIGIVAGLGLMGAAILSGALLVTESLAKEYPEEVYREMSSPDGATKLVIMHYKQYPMYGVKGNIYIEKNGGRRKAADFFVDFIEDLQDEKQTRVRWSEADKAFYFGNERLVAE